jgi:4-amino-4-deoxy-L-arabinose transferase-like glycosyltransferase
MMEEIEEASQKIIDGRKLKIFSWIKQPTNLALLSILVIAFVLRLYYFILTMNQPLWWDELSYGSIAKNFVTHAWDGTPMIVGEMHIRPLLFSFFWAFFLMFNLGEVANRFILCFIPSMISVFFVYLIGKEIYNKKVALIGTLIYSMIWINLFYSSRFLVHMLDLAFLFPSIYFFVKAIKKDINLKYFFISLIFLSLATLTRYPDGLIFFVYFLILILSKKLYLNRIKFWYAGLLGLAPLLLFFLMNFVTQGNILPALFGGDYVHAATKIPFAFNLLNYVPIFLTVPFFILFLIGLIYAIFNIILGYDRLSENELNRNNLLLILICVAIFFFFIFYLRSAEDRYFLQCLATLSLFAGLGLSLIYDYLKNYSKILSIVLVIFVLLIGGYYEIKQADSLIILKKDSYLQMKQAFEWIKANTPSDAVIAGTGIEPYSIYYAQRQYLQFPENYSDIHRIDNATYIVAHGFVSQVPYMNDYLMRNNETLSVVNAFFIDVARTQPIVIIYARNKSY